MNKTVQYILGDEWLNWVTEIWNDKATTLNTTFYGADFQYVPPDHGTSHGGFQLEFVIISQFINHMACYKLSALIG